jgi:hypothetical protein
MEPRDGNSKITMETEVSVQEGAGPGGGPGEERGEAHHRQPEARQGKHHLKDKKKTKDKERK